MLRNAPGKILVIDDDMALRNLLEAIISVNGAEVLLAATPEEAIMHVDREREDISVILLDMNLGTHKGELVYDQITNIIPNIPIFPMSGCHSSEIMERFGKRKTAGLIPKPFDTNELISSLAKATLSNQSSQCI